ncbi:tyrosine-type recombinase/integrase [Lacipirellula limnantheis]|uniref:Tyrosine recombinase XerC n=1 Tax=Lacipirellula limnantheis TaxID=2528024 RepID=A0A517U4K1_9BACT|nr:tyrosine-type recombinase/integrase [Lacipirellula limnantheis]QDT75564.1 Tyrosine recombinase XerC [Lacipirellula limnantheis]
MASITRDKNGHRRIQFVDLDDEQLAIRLGKVSQRAVEALKFRVEQLLAAKQTGHALEADTAHWLAALPTAMAEKLARVGLITRPNTKPAANLGPFLDSYLAGRSDLKPSTKIVRGQLIRDLRQFFGEARQVSTISPGDADDFKQWMVGRELAPATIHKRLQVSRSFFQAMLCRKLIAENPFEGVNASATGIQDRQRFVSRDEVRRVLEACPDHHWRSIVALARYGGLRTPSETLSVRWQDINWEAGRIMVRSPKTDHDAGKASRTIPLIAELRPFLTEAFDLAPIGAEHVVDERYRRAAMGAGGRLNANLRTTFTKIVRRAGFEPWPRLFHNLRASRETELVENYPIQVVTDWLRNTPTVAMRHSLMTTDEHFESAVRGEPEAAQKAAQPGRVSARRESQPTRPAHENTPEMPGCASRCEITQLVEVVRTHPCSSIVRAEGTDNQMFGNPSPARIVGIEANHRGFGLPGSECASSSIWSS